MPNNKQQYLKECFHYNPKNGNLYWKERPREHFLYKKAWEKWNHKYSGEQAFPQKDLHGWYSGWFDHRWVSAHHLIWTLLTGEESEKVWHLDGDRANNKPNNLTSTNPHPAKPDEYLVVYNCTSKNWNVQKNVHSAYKSGVKTTTIIAEFPERQAAVNYKKNRETFSHDRSC